MNRYLTVTATEYYPDTDRLLFGVGFRGCGFKKVYNCPIKRRPVSESVDAKDLIVSNAATDIKSCGRVTQAITMRPSTMKRMQLLGVNTATLICRPSFPRPTTWSTRRSRKSRALQSRHRTSRKTTTAICTNAIPNWTFSALSTRRRARVTGLPLPYKVTIDRDSREVLEIRRNWDEEDDQCLALTVFVKYPFAPGFGFYDIGLLAILGNTAQAATAGWRILLDAGMFSNFPGFLYAKALARQLTNDFRIAPGSGMAIDIVGNIRDAVMPLPYKGPGRRADVAGAGRGNDRPAGWRHCGIAGRRRAPGCAGRDHTWP
jgi:hypothetical protein